MFYRIEQNISSMRKRHQLKARKEHTEEQEINILSHINGLRRDRDLNKRKEAIKRAILQKLEQEVIKRGDSDKESYIMMDSRRSVIYHNKEKNVSMYIYDLEDKNEITYSELIIPKKIFLNIKKDNPIIHKWYEYKVYHNNNDNRYRRIVKRSQKNKQDSQSLVYEADYMKEARNRLKRVING